MQGKQIRSWRESKNIDRKQLAEMCSVSPATVANWELDRNIPHGAALDRLTKLMAGEQAVISLTPQEERILDELVRRGGYASRAAFLTDALLLRIQSDSGPISALKPPRRRAKKSD
jgi:transcriptional regulator with XRE-family HTH domain